MSAAPYAVRCPACGTKNRIPADRIKQGPKCGKCKTPIKLAGLFSGVPTVVTDSSFESEVLRSPVPVLLHCGAARCGYSRMIDPVIDELARDWRGRIKTAKLDIDQNPRTAARFGVTSTPTLLVFDGGILRDTMIGALPKAEIVRRMAPFLSV